jgi:hypothetical protein
VTADPAETPAGTADAAVAADLTAAPETAAADVPPELLAQSLGQYLRAWWVRIRSGDSGILPVVLGLVVVAVVFEIITPEHAFLRDSGGTFTTFDVPGALPTQASSINTAGTITGNYYDASGFFHGFLRDSGGTFTTFDVPGALQTNPLDINTAGAVTGYCQDPSNLWHGFIFTVVTPPHYSVCLLYDPTKAVHSGATIPIKLQLCDGSGNDLSSSSITAHAVSITQTSTSISGPVQDSGTSNPDNDFRFDSALGSTGGYIFNLQTTGRTTGSYNLNFTVTGDSFVYAAPFQVK